MPDPQSKLGRIYANGLRNLAQGTAVLKSSSALPASSPRSQDEAQELASASSTATAQASIGIGNVEYAGGQWIHLFNVHRRLDDEKAPKPELHLLPMLEVLGPSYLGIYKEPSQLSHRWSSVIAAQRQRGAKAGAGSITGGGHGSLSFNFKGTVSLEQNRPVGNLRIFVHSNFPSRALLQEAVARARQGSNGYQSWGVEISDTLENVQLGIISVGHEIIKFVMLDVQIMSLGLNQLGFEIPLTIQAVESAICHAAQFFYCLRFKPTKHKLSSKMVMNVHKLRSDPEGTDYGFILEQENVIDPITNTSVPSPWTVDVSGEDTCYVVELKSDACSDLFASMLYFDCSMLEIVYMYGASATAYSEEASSLLKTGESLPLNYGHGVGGEKPRFALSSHQDINVGFVKIFISTKPFDLSTINQEPLETILPNVDTRSAQGDTIAANPSKWDEITLPVVQKRSYGR